MKNYLITEGLKSMEIFRKFKGLFEPKQYHVKSLETYGAGTFIANLTQVESGKNVQKLLYVQEVKAHQIGVGSTISVGLLGRVRSSV